MCRRVQLWPVQACIQTTLTRYLPIVCSNNTGADLCAGFARNVRCCIHFPWVDRINIHVQVNSVQQWPRYFFLVRFGASWRTRTRQGGIPQMPAWTRVHCRNQLELRRVCCGVFRTRNHNLARFHWLAQDFQCCAIKFRQFVQEQHPIVRQRYFPRVRVCTAARQRHL